MLMAMAVEDWGGRKRNSDVPFVAQKEIGTM